MDRMIIFDDGLGQLGPMTDLRASFEVRTGAFTTATRLVAHRPRTLAGYWVPGHLARLVATRANAPVNDLPNEERLLLVNGRLAVPGAVVELELGSALREVGTQHIVAAHLRFADAEYFLNTGELHERVQTVTAGERLLYRYPWDVMGMAHDAIAHDIEHYRIPDAQVQTSEVVGNYPVEVHTTATLFPNVVLDATQGPIAIHEHAVVRPGAVVCGPCSIGSGCTILDRALLKANTALGPQCKVGGEVGGTIFQGYANKSHDGHLGDSWVGKWANFGAGTTNSNLLNTYGDISVRIEVDGPRMKTGMHYLGAIVGDHVKFAINTRIMTGTVIGTGAMIATTAAPPLTVRRFAWLTDDGERLYALGKFLETAGTVMARRDKTLDEPTIEVLTRLHAMTSEGSAG